MREAGTVTPTGGAPTFEEYVAARGRALWRSAWLLTGDHHRAEDLVQTALMKCCRRWTGEVSTEVLPERAAAEADVEVRRDVLAALARLPRGQRAVIVLRFYDDLAEAQAASALGVTVGTVKSQTARALRTLRQSGLLEET